LSTGADKPGAPRDVHVTGAVDGSVSLSWTAPKDDGGSEVTQYVVEKREALRMSWQSAATVGARTTSATVAGLDPGITYVFRVSAVNAVGTGPPEELSRAVAARSRHSQYSRSFLTLITTQHVPESSNRRFLYTPLYFCPVVSFFFYLLSFFLA